jgi:DNA-binding winged helix-turn-helix (wHTH) protein
VEQQVEANSELNQATFVIAGWTVEPAALRISREDETVKLEPKVMAVLEYLAARAGTVVSRQELEEKVWAGTVVGYDAISNAIIKLRKAFGDSAQNATIIETIPKTGYRLIASVTPTDDNFFRLADLRLFHDFSDGCCRILARALADTGRVRIDRANAVAATGQAFNRCAAICQPEHRPRAGILCRRHDRGPDHRPVQALGPVCGRAKLRVLLQEQKGQDS